MTEQVGLPTFVAPDLRKQCPAQEIGSISGCVLRVDGLERFWADCILPISFLFSRKRLVMPQDDFGSQKSSISVLF